MSRNTVLAGLAATVTALAIAGPAQAQQVISPGQPGTPVISPAQPSTPTPPPVSPAQPSAPSTISPAQPTGPLAGATVKFGDCKVAHSSHGYTYAVCSIAADSIPYGQTIDVGYYSSLKTFKPHTNVKWGAQRGTLKLTNDTAGVTDGQPANVIGAVKLAFKGKSVAQVRKELVVGSTGTNGAALLQPIATTV